MEIDVVSKRKISKNCLVVELEFDFFDFAGRSGKSGNTVENALYQYGRTQHGQTQRTDFHKTE